jgi:hypothetical protein
MDASTGEIAVHVLTEGHADDAAQGPGLLGQAEGVITSATADDCCKALWSVGGSPALPVLSFRGWMSK